MEKKKKKTILIADDNEMNRVLVAEMLKDAFNLIETADGKECIHALERYYSEIDLLLLDVVMPEMDGLEVLAIMNSRDWIKDIPVIMISAETASLYMRRAYDLGAVDYIGRPFDPNIVSRRITNTILLYAKQKQLMAAVADQLYRRERNNSLMLSVLSNIVEFRNGESGIHVLHINAITDLLLRKLAEKTDKYQLSENDISVIRMASSLHDIGKIAIPNDILNKPGLLTPEEFQIMKTHSQIGAQMLSQIPLQSDEPLLIYAKQICRWHHERYDGRGYPDGLQGEEIPIAAQVVSIADVYDALTSERCYKKAYSPETSMHMILNGECGQFNPLLLECLQDISDKLPEELQNANADSMNNSNRVAQRVIQELHDYDSGSDISRNIRLLQESQQRSQILFATSDEPLFEIYMNPPSMVSNQAMQKLFGLPPTLRNPIHSPLLSSVFGDSINPFCNAISKCTYDEPYFTYSLQLKSFRGKGAFQIKGGTLWSEDHQNAVAVIGRFIELDTGNESKGVCGL